MNIASDDVVTFDLSFTSDYDAWIDPKNDMIEDSGRCSVQIDTDDSRFWTTTVTDYYWKCADVDCSATDLTTAVWRSGTYTDTEDTVNDWEAGVTDDDANDLFCTPMSAVAIANSAAITVAEYNALESEAYYACEQIRCVH